MLATIQNSQAKAEKRKQRSLGAEGEYQIRCLSSPCSTILLNYTFVIYNL